MSAILELARRLGKEIANSPEATALRTARAELDKDEEAPKLLKDYQARAEKIAKLEQENKPVEVEDKHKLRELHEKLVASGSFKQFTAAQVEYIDLMRKVNEALRQNLAETEGA